MKNIWLSRDDERGLPDRVFVWRHGPPKFGPDRLTDEVGWDDPEQDVSDDDDLAVHVAEERYGVALRPGECIRLELVPRDYIFAPKEPDGG